MKTNFWSFFIEGFILLGFMNYEKDKTTWDGFM